MKFNPAQIGKWLVALGLGMVWYSLLTFGPFYAHALTKISLAASCPPLAIYGINNANPYTQCEGFDAVSPYSRFNVSMSSASDSVAVNASAMCQDDATKLDVYAYSYNYKGEIYAQCWGGAAGYHSGQQISFQVQHPSGSDYKTPLMIANIFILLLGMGFGWRLSLAPPKFFTE